MTLRIREAALAGRATFLSRNRNRNCLHLEPGQLRDARPAGRWHGVRAGAEGWSFDALVSARTAWRIRERRP